MRFSTLTLLPLLQGVFAVALPFGDFQIHSLRASDSCSSGQGYGANSTTIAFTFQDTNTNLSADCSVTFQGAAGNDAAYDAAFPSQKYRACGNDPSFGFKFSEYHGIADFQLDLLRRYNDPSVGEPPMDVVTLFASTNVTSGQSDYTCKSIRRLGLSCRIPSDATMVVPVTAATAKK